MASANKTSSTPSWGRLLLIAILIVITFLPFLLAINLVDLDNPALAFDWRESFHGAIWLDNFGWDTRPFRTPPWSVYFVLPFTALPFELGWAAMMYVTTIALVAAVPRRPSRNTWLLGTLLLLSAHPVIRNFADVNLEGFVVAGVLLSLYGYKEQKPYVLSLGILLASVKPQSVFLLYGVMGLLMLRTFPRRTLLQVIAICGGVFLVTMAIWAQGWLSSLGTLPTGISLTNGLGVLGWPPIAIIIGQFALGGISVLVALLGKPHLARQKAGLLIAASILVAPYANGTSVVTSLAIGGIAVLMKRRWLGIFIFMIYNLPYLQALGIEQFTVLDSVYFLVIQLILWVVLFVDTIRDYLAGRATMNTRRQMNEETS